MLTDAGENEASEDHAVLTARPGVIFWTVSVKCGGRSKQVARKWGQACFLNHFSKKFGLERKKKRGVVGSKDTFRREK